MMSRLRVRVLLGAFLLGLVVGLWSPLVSQAQVVDPGLQAVGEVTQLSDADPRLIATRIINISLGLLSFILLGVILYAGFLWMTAGGDEKQVQKAKDMIRNGIIGVIIILSSWMIVTFVINKLLGAVGGDGGGGPRGGGPGTGSISDGGGAGALGFRVRAITPSGPVPLRNVEVQFAFSREVRENTVASSIKVLRASDQLPVDGTLNIEGSMITFTPAAPCPAPFEARRCLAGDTEYIARVEGSLRSAVGQVISCGGTSPACEVRFTTSNRVDATVPEVWIFAPLFGQGVPANDLIRVQTHASDDSGVSLIESFADGRSLGTAVRSDTSTSPFLDGTLIWDTHGVATGTHQLLSRARDLDSNRATSTPVMVVVRPRHCFNEVQDEGETGLNCGGDCGVCAGGSCRVAMDCAGGICGEGNTCVEQPVITAVTPLNGAPGTYVTIQGVNFGTTTGQVLFGGRPALAPDACAAGGASLWTQNQTVVQVPVGATTGTIQLIHRNGLSDTTTDGQGPRLGEFAINTRTYPGLCAITPASAPLGSNTRLDLRGVNLGSSSDQVNFNDRSMTSFLSWSDRAIALTSPVISPGSYAVQAQVRGVNSNPVFFRLDERAVSAAPVIDFIDPATGTAGSYITITGRNFGNSGQVQFRSGALHAVADTNFPAACSNNYWRDTSVIVKIPANMLDGLGASSPIRPGMFDVTISHDGLPESPRRPFEVVAGAPLPSICAIQPVAGPGGTPITVIGEHLGGTPARLEFPADSVPTVDATITTWTDQQIQSTVPLTAASGLVHVLTNGLRSNGVAFTARNCNEEAGICQNGQACCSDGSCAVNGVCRNAPTAAQFAWRTSTGRIILNPQVVEACNIQDPPSPSPLSTREGGNSVCVNAQVVALFTTHLDRSTVTLRSGNTGNILITRCTGTTGDPCSTGTPEVITGPAPELHTHDAQRDYIVFTPGGTGLWQPDSTYQVIFKKDIRASAADGGLTMLENRERYGVGNGYAFRFKTKASAELCQASSVSVSPFNWAMEQLGETKEYTLSARGEDICVQLNSHVMGWDWSVSDAGRAAFSPAADDQDIQTIEGIGATETPVQITASLNRPVPPRPVRGSGNLSIRIQPPQVADHGPDCDQACINAALWARFNVAMDPASLTHLENGRQVPNVIARRCVNQSCRAFDLNVAITPSMLRLENAVGAGNTTNTMLIVDSGRTTLLERERFYKVWVIGGEQGVRSAYGRLPLAGLNDTNPVGFSWTFRVKSGTNPVCTVDRVDVVPGEKYENVIGARQLFSARPVSAPDSCSRTGQILNTSGDFTWDTSDDRVADFAQIGDTRSSVSLATTLPPYCTNRCTNAGSQGVAGRIALCGNAKVETVNPQLCHPRSAPNRNCRVTDTDCETATRVNCVLLPPGSTGSEECDETSAYCSAQCLWVGQSSRATGGTCGDSVVDRGEQCDAGSTCVGGTAPGRDCSVDQSVCGTGGTCVVANRQGCATSCLALGAQAGGSTCGNGDIADGETCDDGNQINGDGCSNDCRAEGSSMGLTSFCGDGTVDPGESCEISAQGNHYCRMIDGEKVCDEASVFQNLCDPVTCLNRGTNRGTTAGMCGNGTTDSGEDCDGGQGCSTRCLFQGSSAGYTTPSICGDRTIGTGEQCEAPSTATTAPARSQLFEITGLREPNTDERTNNGNRMKANLSALYDARTGQATYGVSCNFTSELSCAAGTGLTSGGCCAPRPQANPQYPTGNDVCRNTVIYAHFNQPMDHGSIDRNFILAKSVVAATCPAGTTLLDNDRPVATGWRGWIASLWRHLLSLFTTDEALAGPETIWCIGSTQGRVTYSEEEDGSTTASFILNQALDPNTDYQVVLRGEIDLTRAASSTRGIRSSRGVVAAGNITWRFHTGADVCLVSAVDIQDNARQHPYLFYRAGEVHRYTARAISLRNGVQAPIAPIDGLYSWSWERWANSNDTVVRVTEGASVPLQTVATTTAQNKNGSAIVVGGLQITADQVSTSTTIGKIFSASRLSTVILCENPWVPETAENTSHLPRFQDIDFNFVTTYCRDAGERGAVDDLPSVIIHRLPSSPVDINRGVLRQYLFSFDDPALRGDGIGIRIVSNRLHLSPSDWYLSQGFNGQPQVTTVDGYEALRDGATIYVGAANTDDAMTRADTNIYILSRNPNAGPVATSIFDQMVTSLTFNGNLSGQEQRVCVNDRGAQYIDPTGNGLIHCTADWECVRQSSALHCASAKEKIQRDLVRISNFQSMTAKLSETKVRQGSYPTLPTGTQLPGFVTSRWAGWQSVFGAALGGTSLPQDPINQYLSCGRCEGSSTMCAQDSECAQGSHCIGINGRDPASCWSTASSTYACPIYAASNPFSISHVYQYRALANGSRYELGTELESLAANQYRPPLVTEAKRCANTRGLCERDTDCDVVAGDGRITSAPAGSCTPLGGRWIYDNICRGQAFGNGQQCGDGVIDSRPGTVEVCEIGQRRIASCPLAGGVTGAITQVCQNDCRGFTNVIGATCQSETLCGNGRVDARRCTGGVAAGPNYGITCQTDNDCDRGVTCQALAVPEICDDGALNGTYGRCNRSCNGFGGTCGDGEISAGEVCDLGEQNGQYCNTAGSCDLGATCGADCHSRSSFCGDHQVQAPEECDGASAEASAEAVTGQTACTNVKAGLCSGGPQANHTCSCTSGDSCVDATNCGAGNTCVMYRTQHVRTCINPGITPVAEQCRWTAWSSCQPVSQCGDGVTDAGEQCDDGNHSDNDACTNSCKNNICGDSALYSGVEECDYGTARNGASCSNADYGSTCVACTAQCRMTASSGGYCGDNVRQRTEQCDGTSLGDNATNLTCQSLGFDYAEQVTCAHYGYATERSTGRILCVNTGPGDLNTPCSVCVNGVDCDVVWHAPSMLAAEDLDGRYSGACRANPTSCGTNASCVQLYPSRRDGISCGRTCSFAGCKRCSDERGTEVISGQVLDAQYSGLAVPSARVTLYQRGTRITEVFTNDEGNFTISTLSSQRECSQYRIVVDSNRNNPKTTNVDESVNGGYWPFESRQFTAADFREVGIRNSAGKIFLIPRVGRGETLVVHTWDGDLGGRYLMSHLILPSNRAYRPSSYPAAWDGGTDFRLDACGGSAPTAFCFRDIREQHDGRGLQGNPSLTQAPFARLFCSASGGAGACFRVNVGPQATRYRLQPSPAPEAALPGTFTYYIVDQLLAGRTVRSADFYRETKSTVYVVTSDRISTINPPEGVPTYCEGKYWRVFSQDAVTGAVTIPDNAELAYQCGNDPIPNDPTNNRLPTTGWQNSQDSSWLQFGGGIDYNAVDWDVRRTTPLHLAR